mmetsp:Transcript_18241/g.38304  ORF Transcript_18241/g.38304 Transcript_18241/m.38304 type:complete len:112 (-) Transcript_18241:1396-1731(-)
MYHALQANNKSCDIYYSASSNKVHPKVSFPTTANLLTATTTPALSRQRLPKRRTEQLRLMLLQISHQIAQRRKDPTRFQFRQSGRRGHDGGQPHEQPEQVLAAVNFRQAFG